MNQIIITNKNSNTRLPSSFYPIQPQISWTEDHTIPLFYQIQRAPFRRFGTYYPVWSTPVNKYQQNIIQYVYRTTKI